MDSADELAPGIWAVSTPSHGGLCLSPERMAAVPAYMLTDGSFAKQRAAGWFEEDCDWSLVALVFPEAFEEGRALPVAHETAAHWHAEAYRKSMAEIEYPTEPTPIGNQYVIPGCEKDKTRGPVQPDLF